MSTAQVRIQATGKRKTSVARIILESGDGTITCNGRPIEDFFGRKVLVTAAKSPLVAAGAPGTTCSMPGAHNSGSPPGARWPDESGNTPSSGTTFG